ncbi:MAG TPA: MG2 domain-containing protein, partial [Vicinamibacterales bacterium]|nr:MG2 domain-containing protein [Vicinamibacterales bacterium]
MSKGVSPSILVFVCLAVCTLCPSPAGAAQPGSAAPQRRLSVVSAGPTGEVASLAEANEIRVIFSDPMVALGRIPQPVEAPFFKISPHVEGTLRWSGTTILIFTPADRRPLPFATRFDVTIDGSATSVSGRRLGTPYSFSFVTPTVRLLAAEWVRRTGRYTDPVTIFLRFNQPVRPAHVATHLALAFERHPWAAPAFTPAALARMKALNPQALAAFEAKAAAAARAAAATGPVQAVPTNFWDKERFPPSPDLVVLETTTPVPPDSWVNLVLDTRVMGLQGTETPPTRQSKILELEPTFFVSHFYCTVACNPDSGNPLHLRGEVKVGALAKAVRATDISDPKREVPVERSKPPLGEREQEEYVYDTSGAFTLEDLGFVHPPARTFAVGVSADLTLPDGQTLGYDWLGIVENWHQVAFTSFGDGHGVWEASGGTQLPFYARNFRDVTQWASPLSPADLMPTIRTLRERSFTIAPPAPGQPRRLAPVPDKIQSYGLDLAGALAKAPTGLVWAAVEDGTPIPQSRRERTDQLVRSTVVQVTNLGITVKYSPQNTLVFVTRLDDGAPVPGAEVQFVTLENKVFWTGATDQRGIVVAPDTRGLWDAPARTGYSAYHRFTFIVTARKGGDVAYVVNDWAEGIEPWQFGARFDPGEADPILRGTVFADRGVYRPGEEVHIKAILREDAPGAVRLVSPATPIHVSVTDSQGRNVDRRVVKLNEWSAAEWTFTVPAEGSLGDYSVAASLDAPEQDQRAQRGGEQGEWEEESPRWRRTVRGSFLVAAYRRPEFRVDVTLGGEGRPGGAQPLAGATLGGTVTAKYLFGAPMARRPIRWSFTRIPGYSAPRAIVDAFEAQSFRFGGDYHHESSLQVAADQATLDASGALTLDLQTTAGVDRPYRYVLEGEVEDVSRQTIAGRAAVDVHPAPWYIGVRLPDYFVDPKKGLDTEIIAVGPDAQMVPGVAVTVSLVQVQWQSVRRAEGKGFYNWETQRIEKEAGSWEVTSAEKGVPLHVPLEHGGYYQVVARARDAENRSTRTTVGFYAVGAGYTAWQRYDHNRIEIVPEKGTYRPGETARLMIKSPWEQATALLTTEREGIRTQRQFTLTSTQQSVTVPITEADIPNVYVSVLLVKGRTKAGASDDDSDPGKPSFRLGYAELQVEDAGKRLTVVVRSNKDEYRPANPGTVDVEVRDAAGKPARAEVTLWAVDYGVLSLTGFQTPDVLASVYIRKALQVATADSRQRIVSRRVLTPKGETEGGGGGADQGAGTMRKDFRILAFWVGSVVTDGNGRARVNVTLPESLTTYRIMAVAGDKASRFGGGESEIRINKPVMLRAAFPRFLAVGDSGFFGGVVNSQLARGGTATVSIKSLDPGLLAFPGETSQSVAVGPRGAAEVRFAAQARTIGRARVQMTVKLENETDAFEDVIPVAILHSPETVAAYGQTTGEAVERLALPPAVVPGFGGLRVDLSSTALVGLNEGARFLVEYPYGCAEQQGSRALALLLAADLGDAFKLEGLDPQSARTRVQQALRELEKFQCDDGGFAYWPGKCWSRSEYLTSYLLHVFKVAKSLGYEVDASMVDRALGYLERRMGEPPPVNEGWWPSYTAWQAFAAKVLVEGGRNQDSNINRLYGYLDRMPVFAVAYLHDALLAKGERGPRVDELARRMSNAILPEGGSAHVEELADPYLLWFWNSNVRTTAIVLGTLVRRVESDAAKRAESDAAVRPMVRWLMNVRKKGRWGNTQENAWAMEALVAYYRKFEPEAPDFAALVTLDAAGPRGGKGGPPEQLAREVFKGRSTETRLHEMPMAKLLAKAPAAQDLDLKFTRHGTGTLFYEARLRYTSNELFTEGMDSGFLVERSYAPLVEPGVAQPPETTTFQAGDLVRVTLTFTLPKERRYVAATDPLPAGFEAVESWFATTASDLARDQESGGQPEGGWFNWWQRGGFDHIERHDDRVLMFATRLSEGRHVFSYVARATTAGTFRTAPAHAEEMYEPEVFG